MSQHFTSGGQNIGASASSVLPVNIQDWFPLGLTSLISLKTKGLPKVLSNTKVQKHQFFDSKPSLWSNSHIHTWLLGKAIVWLYRPLSPKWCLCLLFRFAITFLPRRKHLNFMAAVTICSACRAQENTVCLLKKSLSFYRKNCFHLFPMYLPWSDETTCHDLHLLNVEFKKAFHSPLSPSSKGSLVPLCFLLLGWCHLSIWGYWYFF